MVKIGFAIAMRDWSKVQLIYPCL